METEKCQIEALTRDIEQSRAELKEQEDDFKSQLQKQEQELTRISTWLQEHQAEFKVCLSKKEQLERKYDDDVKKLLEVTKKQDDIEAVNKLKEHGEIGKELKEHKELIAKQEQEQTIKQLREQLDELVKKSSTQERQIKELVEKIQLKEAENAIFKQDFESERTDRQRIHDECEELKIKTEEARQQHKADKDAMAQLAEEKENYEEEIQILTAQVNAYSREVDKQKGLVTQSQEKHKTEVNELNERLANEIKSKQQLASVQARLRQQLDDALADKEKAVCSQQQLRQQLANVSADKEELLRAYHEERARLEDLIEKLKKANKVLMDKINAYKSGATSATDTPRLSPNSPRRHHRNNAPPTSKPSIFVWHNDDSNYQVLAHSGGARDEYVMNQEETHHNSNRLHSDDVANVQPLMTAEDMVRRFKQQPQPAPKQQQPAAPQPAPYPPHQQQQPAAYYRPEQQQPRQHGPAYHIPPSLIQLEADTDNILKELDRSRKTYLTPHHPSPVLPRRQPPSPELDSAQELPEDDKDDDNNDDDDDDDRPLDPNLVCPKCGKQYRVGEIQKLRRHINARCSNKDSDESHEEIDKDEEEIRQMAEQHRKEMQGPTTDEVLFDDGDSSLPYDPNLVCPKCGKQYRVGEIQKLRRHINEFCTGIR